MKNIAVAGTLVALVCAAAPVRPQVSAPTRYTPNVWNVEVKVLTESLSSDLGKIFVVDPSVKTRIYWSPQTSIPASAFYSEFVQMLKAHKLSVVENDGVVAIANATTEEASNR
jgi:type II secretory pathway component GspD/PulD (secretin)